MVTSAVILAGGLGTRLRSAVPDLPKPMAPVSGRPFLTHLMDYWIQQGVARFVLSVGYRFQTIVDFFGNNYRGAAVEYVIETTPLGTGGGLLLAAAKLCSSQPFLLLNGDTYFAVDLKALTAFAVDSRADWCFSMFEASEVGRYMGMDVSPHGSITALRSESGLPGRPANGGVYWVNPSALQGLPYAPGEKVSLEDDIFPAAMSAGQRLMGLQFDAAFIDIGVPVDYQRAPEFLTK